MVIVCPRTSRWFQASSWLSGGWVCTWRLRCLDYLQTPRGKHWRRKPLRTTPSTQCGMKNQSSSRRWQRSGKNTKIARQGLMFYCLWTGDPSNPGLAENRSLWGRRKVYRPSDHSRLGHKTRYFLFIYYVLFHFSVHSLIFPLLNLSHLVLALSV